MNNPKPKEWLSDVYSRHKIADYKPYNFVDGEGVRCSLYVSGCKFACEGCYNLVAQNFNYGIIYTLELQERILNDIAQPYCQGLTLLGGEPFLNTHVCLSLVYAFREKFNQQKDIWSWTGYTWEELMSESDDKLELLKQIDILVDGRFDITQKDLTLQFRGSKNQRIIDVQKSFAQHKVVLWDKLVL
ncbi:MULTISPECIES: anaerobic ribonucleoside-triphosphate reductase activating protein [unclassified Granulicatella]|uniref:anaerobic ribonucleoside-triphosphate reductase activating protein n=1 Tax=unclassified Granulicatella TaxID=2630493 RepID=UPI0010730ABA|nr:MULTISPECIES: anaerobic ribonucleoside-triphosphate reductase activating protein [unclassified Granulicatella]MBF0780833.1 anaerobic ribonucleoside-triphosphate reductase activating protein [Granulicatella sp. 19428wC4_WM01]TFU93520.1 anaerobic ribonucleoside-triphosphate reductase activating protein [Granulicatella sp. WM01]